MSRPHPHVSRVSAVLLGITVLVSAGCLPWQTETTTSGDHLRDGDHALAYEVHGSPADPAVVLLHGFGSSRRVWAGLIPALAGAHRVIAVDLVGFGESSRRPGDYSPEAQVRRVLALLDDLGVDRADVVAHSMGSVAALAMAESAPDRVGRIALLGAWVYDEQMPWFLRAALPPGGGEFLFGAWYDAHLDARFRYSFHDADHWVTEGMVERAREQIARPGTRAAALASLRDLGLAERQDRYGAIGHSVLLIQGEEDAVARPRFAERLGGQLPAARLERVAGVGHFAMLEARARVASLLDAFLAGPSPAPAPPLVVGPAPPAPPTKFREVVTLDGYFRARGALLVDHDLDRGPTPTTGEPIFPLPLGGGEVLGSVDARLRMDVGIRIGEVARAKVRVDALDGLVLGSTPEGFPPTRWAQTPWASLRQTPPSTGFNAFVDSIRVKEAYGEVFLPVGLLAFGRMDVPTWGLGMVSGPADAVDDDWTDPVDRIAFATSVADHLFALAFDINAVGPTSATSAGTLHGGPQPLDLELGDNLFSVTTSFGRFHDDAAIRRRRAADKATFSWGVYGSYRWQNAEFPAYHLAGIAGEDASYTLDDAVQRRLKAGLVDGWLRLHAGPIRAEVEVAYGHASIEDPSLTSAVSLPSITADQVGVVFDLEGRPVEPLSLEIEAGLASGDDAPGIGVAPPLGQATSRAGDLEGPQFDLRDDTTVNNFRFHPGYRVDLIFWRTIVGAVSDAFYVRPQLRVRPMETLEIGVSGVVSAAMKPESTPGDGRLYGGEVDLRIDWHPVPGFRAILEYGAFFPGAGLDNPDLEVRATPAQALRATLAVQW